MGLQRFLCLLLCAVFLIVSRDSVEDGSNKVSRWTKQSLPVLLDTNSKLLNTALFRGQGEDDEKGRENTIFEFECQGSL